MAKAKEIRNLICNTCHEPVYMCIECHNYFIDKQEIFCCTHTNTKDEGHCCDDCESALSLEVRLN